MENMTRVTVKVLTIEPRTERSDWSRGTKLSLRAQRGAVTTKKRGGEA